MHDWIGSYAAWVEHHQYYPPLSALQYPQLCSWLSGGPRGTEEGCVRCCYHQNLHTFPRNMFY